MTSSELIALLLIINDLFFRNSDVLILKVAYISELEQVG